MKILTVSFIGIVLALGLYVWLISPRAWMAVVSLGVIYFLIYLGVSGTMGLPKPYGIPNEIKIIAYSFDEGRGIYLWVQEFPPRAYGIPWDKETAKKLRQAGKDAEGQHTDLMMRTTGTPDGEIMFYPLPPQESPPKSPW